MSPHASLHDRVCRAVQPQRLLETVRKLVAVPSRTGEAKGALDCLADILAAEGFAVERPDGGYPQAPAVAVRWAAKQPGARCNSTGISTQSICRSCHRRSTATCCAAAVRPI